MDDFRFLQDNALWIIIIAIFLLFLLGGNGCNSFGSDFLGNLFNGCGNNSWIWIIIAVVVIYFLFIGDCGGGFLRNDMQ